MIIPPPKLKEFNMSNNSLTEIDHKILPQSLSSLNISYNQLKSVRIEDMPALTILFAQQNTDLSEIILRNTPKLK